MRVLMWCWFVSLVGVGCRDAGDLSSPRSLLDSVENDSAHLVSVGGDETEVITLRLGDKLEIPVQLQAGSVLDFSLALLSEIGPEDGIEFRIYVETGGSRARAFDDVLGPRATHGWQPRRADLTPWGTTPVVLTLETRRAKGAVGNTAPRVAVGKAFLGNEIHVEGVERGVSLFNEWSRGGARRRKRFDTPAVKDTKFSHDRGFYVQPFDLTIATATLDATVVFTTDGSQPSRDNGHIGNTLYISRTTVVRAMAYKDGMAPTNIDTHTFIFPETVREQTSLPFDYPPAPSLETGGDGSTLAPRTDLDMEIDPDVVSSTNNDLFVRGLLSIPTLSLVADADELFHPARGLYFDRFPPTRAASVELLYPLQPGFAGFAGFQVDCAVKAHSKIDGIQKRSFRLVFSKDFGPGKLRYPLFESAVHHADSAVREFDTIVLRAGGQANWSKDDAPVGKKATYVRDQHVRDSQLTLSGLASHGMFAHLYINGVYWGVYNAVERPDQRFLASYLGGEPYTDWLAVNRAGPLGEPPPSSRWDDVHIFAAENDLSVPESYAHMQTLLDTAQFSDYILLNWFSGMSDWGKNNWYSAVRVQPAGRCMYFCWDSEMTYDLVRGYGAPGAWVDRAFLKPSEVSFRNLWQQLEVNPEFLLEFADRVHRSMQYGGPLSDDINRANFRRLADYVEDAMVCESARWGDSSPSLADTPRTKDGDWVPARDDVLRQMEGNAARFIRALQEHHYYPSIDPPSIMRQGDQLVITRPDGASYVFYTIDGTDPRGPNALHFSEAVMRIASTPNLKTRARTGDEWSALHAYGVWNER